MAKLYQMTEDKVASQLGISRERLKGIREQHLEHGTHFQKTASAVAYTEDGVQTVIQFLTDQARDAINNTGPDASPPAPTGGGDPPAPPPEEKRRPLETLRILRTCPNPTWVEAFNEAGRRVKCRVRSNQSMRRGIILKKCERLPDGTYKTLTRF